MTKLTKSNPSASQTVIRVEGCLTAETVGEFAGLLGTDSNPTTITIDLSALTSLDEAARAFLTTLRNAGCRLVGGSLYVNQMLKEA